MSVNVRRELFSVELDHDCDEISGSSDCDFPDLSSDFACWPVPYYADDLDGSGDGWF